MIKCKYLIFAFVIGFNIKIIQAVNISHIVQLHPNQTCVEMLSTLSIRFSKLMRCLSSKSWPFSICQECSDEYYEVTTMYNSILSTKTEESGSCEDLMLKADRVQIVKHMHQMVMNLWTKSSCDDCYLTEMNGAFVLSNDTLTFDLHYNETMDCIRKSNKRNTHELNERNDAVCDKCRSKYDQLNEIYNGFNKGLDELCMDTVFKMNQTRASWSNEYDCLKPNTSLETIIIILSFSLMGGFVLYVLSWLILTTEEDCLIKVDASVLNEDKSRDLQDDVLPVA